MKSTRILLVWIAVSFYFAVSGQGIIPIEDDRCGTMEIDRLNRLKYPERGTLDDFERDIANKINEFKSLQQQGRIEATVLTIPVIVHVVHSGEPVGSGTNLSQAQIQAQLEVLNEDFRRLPGTPGFNNNPVGADIEIEFCLSPVDQNGLPMAEPGIHRYNGGKANGWTRDEIENQLKPITIWNANLFYNIWTVRFAASEPSLLGYAQFPDQSGLSGLPTSGPASTDGVVIRYTQFGSADKGNFPIMQPPYNKGRTLTHETGHWLGLRHIWGDANCGDDFVSDTPQAAGPSSGCPVGRISCGVTNMVENYMDYSNDACMNIFTLGQKARMRAVMEVSPRRKSLAENSLCTPLIEDVPVANFSTDKQLVLLGGTVKFTDLSSNFPSSWSWTFEGGSPSTSTQRNPTVEYNIAGTYLVRLVATNIIGSSEPLVIEDYITVSDLGICSSMTNFEENYTPSTLDAADYGSYTGYLTGHNSIGIGAISEFFENSLGYAYVHSVDIKFSHVEASSEDATLTVLVWNARGPQSAPGSVIERKTVLLKQIEMDIAENRPTTVVFDRETPVFNRAFHVGIELDYTNGDVVAIESSADGEALSATSWVRDVPDQESPSAWTPYTIAFGANIALNIKPNIGMNTSVQVSSSKLLVYPGEEVILNGRGASVFVWNSGDGTVEDKTGPQLVVNPTNTTTYLIIGSGLELCYDSAYTTIYVRTDVTGTEDPIAELGKGLSVYPNPGDDVIRVRIENGYMGPVRISLRTVMGKEIDVPRTVLKDEAAYEIAMAVPGIEPGLYVVVVEMGGHHFIRKWIKL